jgi:hypothetical protein
MALLSKHDGRIIAKRPIPLLDERNEIDVLQMRTWLEAHDPHPHKLMVVVEEAPHHAPSTSAVRSLALNVGILTGYFASRGYYMRRPLSQRWQGELLGKVEKGGSKAAAAAFAATYWPGETWFGSVRSKKPHDGMIDAACLAEWGRRAK